MRRTRSRGELVSLIQSVKERLILACDKGDARMAYLLRGYLERLKRSAKT